MNFLYSILRRNKEETRLTKLHEIIGASIYDRYFEWRKKTRKLSRHIHRQRHDKLDGFAYISMI